MTSINYPPNPYLGPLKVYEGTLLTITGKPRMNAVEFNINLQTGYQVNPRDDVALIIRVNFANPRIIRSTIQNQQFSTIEDHGDATRLNPYEPFEFKILNQEREGRFMIALNGQHFCEYRHRIPTPAITCLAIDGDLDIHCIQVASPDPIPQQMPPACPYPPNMGSGMPTPQLYPSVPVPASMPTAGYPPSMPPGPMPGPMPTPAAGPYGQAPMPGYPAAPGPAPTPAYYPGGYPVPGNAYPQQPGGYGQPPGYGQPHGQHHSSGGASSFLNSSGLGTIAGLGLGAAAGAAVLSAFNPLKPIKKMMKPGKLFKSNSSSNSSISSMGSFSSNSS